jgi:3-(3-hydroxy-phenyl)propionate hydroxylase
MSGRFLAAARDTLISTTVRIPGLGGWIRRAKIKPAPRFRRGAYLGLRARDTRFVTVYPLGGRPRGKPGEGRDDLTDIEDHTGTLTHWFRRARLRPGGVALLRPARYVFGTAEPSETAALVAALRHQLHLPIPPVGLTQPASVRLPEPAAPSAEPTSGFLGLAVQRGTHT